MYGRGRNATDNNIMLLMHFVYWLKKVTGDILIIIFNLLTPELIPSAQHCLPRFFIGDLHF
jgi:hypothetical protein